MKVYIKFYEEPYEGKNIINVYSTLELAKAGEEFEVSSWSKKCWCNYKKYYFIEEHEVVSE